MLAAAIAATELSGGYFPYSLVPPAMASALTTDVIQAREGLLYKAMVLILI